MFPLFCLCAIIILDGVISFRKAKIMVYKHGCKMCGIDFETKKKTSKFCSKVCLSKNNVKATQIKQEKICTICNKPFLGKSNQKYCSPKCARKANNESCMKIVCCKICGNEFKTRHHKTQKCCSPACGNKLKSKSNTIKKICKKCGEEFYVKNSRDNRYNVTYCSIDCYGKTHQSSYEHEIKSILESSGINNIVERYKPDWLSRKEIDLYLPDHKIGVEFNGIYWHSESAGKNKGYHFNKSKLCAENGVRLVHIFEDAWVSRREAIMKRLFNMIPNNDKIYARNCVVKFGNKQEVVKFVGKYHTQGNISFEYSVKLLCDGEIVSVLTIGKQRKILGSNPEEGKFEILRYCSKKRVVGGFSKMLKYFIKSINPKEITTFMDLDWNFDTANNVYAKNGFALSHISPPNYWYVSKEMVRKHRIQCRKSKLVDSGYDKNKSESEIMKELGYWKVWNCGSAKFIMSF